MKIESIELVEKLIQSHQYLLHSMRDEIEKLELTKKWSRSTESYMLITTSKREIIIKEQLSDLYKLKDMLSEKLESPSI
jgi:hypothetical protein